MSRECIKITEKLIDFVLLGSSKCDKITTNSIINGLSDSFKLDKELIKSFYGIITLDK